MSHEWVQRVKGEIFFYMGRGYKGLVGKGQWILSLGLICKEVYILEQRASHLSKGFLLLLITTHVKSAEHTLTDITLGRTKNHFMGISREVPKEKKERRNHEHEHGEHGEGVG